MRIAISCDHAGFPYKGAVICVVRHAGHDIEDLGTDSSDPVDYPDFAEVVGRAIQTGRADRGIVICGSGIGSAIAANKMHGVRAGVGHDIYSVQQGVEHDDMNVLALGARVIGIALIAPLVTAFLSARFTKEARHLRRLAKIAALEKSAVT